MCTLQAPWDASFQLCPVLGLWDVMGLNGQGWARREWSDRGQGHFTRRTGREVLRKGAGFCNTVTEQDAVRASWVPEPFCVPSFLFAGKRLLASSTSLPSEAQTEGGAN